MIAAGAVRLRGRSGLNRTRFQGRLSRTTRLRAGRYSVRVVATDAAGQTATARRLSFRIVRDPIGR